MTDDNEEFMDDEPIEPLFDDNGQMKQEHLAQAADILKMLAKKMEEKPGADPFDHIDDLLGKQGMADLAKTMIEPLRPHWGKAPEGSECSVCHSKNVERSFIMIGGPFAGSYRCLDCGDQRSLMSHIAKTCIKIEPLPAGVLPDYYDEETK